MRLRLVAAIVFFAVPLAAQDLLLSSRFTDVVFRYDATTGAFKGIFAGGNGLANPNGIAIGPDGNLYAGLGDTGKVLRFDGQSGAFIDTFVSDAALGGCRAIKFGPDGNLYVAAGPNDKILRYDGHSGQPAGVAAALPAGTGPVGMAIAADGTLFVGGGLDGKLHVVKDGTELRRCNVGIAATGVAIGGDGRVYVASGAGRTILRFNADSCANATTFASNLNLPVYLTFDRVGNLLAGISNDNTVVRIDPNGKNLGVLVASGSGGLNGPHDMTFVPELRPQVQTTPHLVVPGVARVPGAGSFFRTTLWMTNPAGAAATVRLRFLPGAGFDRAGATDSDIMTIPAHGSLAFADVVGDVFHPTGNTAGVAIVETAEGSPLPLVTARTFNDTDKGTYGQFIQALPLSSAATGESWIHGLAADSSSRTNIGLVNFGAADVAATLTLWSAAGIQLGNDVPVTIPAHTSIQLGNVPGSAGLGALPEFAVRATTSGLAAYALFASKLDNVTSDPIFITPIPARSRQWIDGVGAITGVGGTRFRSSLSIANRTDGIVHVHVDYVARGDGAASHGAEFVLGAGESRFFTNLIAELFDGDGTVGTLLLTSDAPVQAWARTYSDGDVKGTFGQFIPSFGAEDLVGAAGAILPGLSQDQSFRTNVGFFNTAATPVVVTATAYDNSGSAIASATVPVAAGQESAINGILATLGIAPRSDVHLKIESSIPGVVYAWASMVDNLSTDQTFVRPMLLER